MKAAELLVQTAILVVERLPNPVDDPSEPFKDKIDSLPQRLRIFLEPSTKLSDRSTKCDLVKEIIYWFHPALQKYPRDIKKFALVNNFMDLVFPHLSTSIRARVPPTPMEPDNQFAALDPEASTSTAPILRTALTQASTHLLVTKLQTKGELVKMFKKLKARTTGLVLPSEPYPFDASKPMTTDELNQKKRDDIRYAIQYHRPDLFIPSSAISKPMLVSLYERFVNGNEVGVDVLVEGVHYYLITHPRPAVS